MSLEHTFISTFDYCAGLMLKVLYTQSFIK